MNFLLKLFEHASKDEPKEHKCSNGKALPFIDDMTTEEKLEIINKRRIAEGKDPLSLEFKCSKRSLTQEEKQKIIDECKLKKNKGKRVKER